jgi:SAM-dependent methyltransferase
MSLVSQIYETSDVNTLPEDVTGLSLGCGDPVTLATLEPGQTVLDLGSGGGIDCFLAAKQVGERGRVIGVDMTTTMLEKARANKAKLGAENVEFRLGEIEHLPVEDEAIDVVISNCVINLSPDKPQVFHEAFRVLKPGGRLAVSDIVTAGPLPQEIKDDLSAWAGCVAGALESDDYIAAIKDAGFVDVQLTPTYLDESLLEDAAKQLGMEILEDPNNGAHMLAMKLDDGTVKEIDLGSAKDGQAKALQQAVFSAKVTARKPGREEADAS